MPAADIERRQPGARIVRGDGDDMGWTREGSAYDVLGVTPTAPPEVVRAAYRARLKTTHPDRGGDPEQAAALTEAFAILDDPALRREHDEELSRRDNPSTESVPASGWSSPTSSSSSGARQRGTSGPTAQEGPRTSARATPPPPPPHSPPFPPPPPYQPQTWPDPSSTPLWARQGMPTVPHRWSRQGLAVFSIWILLTLAGAAGSIVNGGGWGSLGWVVVLAALGWLFAAVRGAGGPISARWVVGALLFLCVLIGEASFGAVEGAVVLGAWGAVWVVTVELAGRSARKRRSAS